MSKQGIAVAFGLHLMLFSSLAFPVDSICGEILESGIYDSHVSLDDRNSFELAKKLHCSSSVSTSERTSARRGKLGGIGSGGSSSTNLSEQSNEFCRSDFRQTMSNTAQRSFVQTVNQGIVEAWSQCQSMLSGQTLHRIIPARSDPSEFGYEIIYSSSEEPFTNVIKSIDISNGQCSQLTEGAGLDLELKGAMRFNCSRDPDETVTIATNVEHHNTYVHHLELWPRETIRSLPTVAICKKQNLEGCRHFSDSTGFMRPSPLGDDVRSIQIMDSRCKVRVWGKPGLKHPTILVEESNNSVWDTLGSHNGGERKEPDGFEVICDWGPYEPKTS